MTDSVKHVNSVRAALNYLKISSRWHAADAAVTAASAACRLLQRSITFKTGDIYIYMVCELIETIKVECSGSGCGTPDDMATAQSFCFLSVPNPSRKRISQFLAECVESRKRKVDLEGVLVKRRNEQLKLVSR